LGGTDYGKTASTLLERGLGNPSALLALGRKRLTALLVKASHGTWREARADTLRAAAHTTLRLVGEHSLDFAELAEDLAGEARIASLLTREIETLDERIEALYDTADPKGSSSPGPASG
jgi:hypothetical protein